MCGQEGGHKLSKLDKTVSKTGEKCTNHNQMQFR